MTHPPTETRRTTPPLRAALVLLALLAACAAEPLETRYRDWSASDVEGAALLARPEMSLPVLSQDPAEPTNRKLEGLNQTLVAYAAGPVTRGWRWAVPEGVRERIANVSDNLAFPRRGVNCAAQGEWADAGTELLRFVINTTVGILGIFDPAESMGLAAPPPEDTGLTFVDWGWERSDALFVPLMGPSTKRDLLGLVPDTLLDLSFWISGPLWIVFGINGAADVVPVYETLVATQQDPYVLARLAWTVSRAAQVADFAWAPSDAPASATMQAVFIAPQDPDFRRRASTGHVTMPGTGRELPYSTWMQEEPAPVAYLLPGLGSHRLSGQPVTMAETLFRDGWSVVVISNALHPEFLELGLSSPLVGYTPRDVEDVYDALVRVDAQLVERHGEAHLARRSLMGISMGAFHTTFLCARQELRPEDSPLRFDQFAAFAIPVSLRHGLRQLDAFYEAPLAWPDAEREERMVSVLRRALSLGDGTFRPGSPLPFTEGEARFLIGLSFRLTLLDLLWTTQQREDRGVLLTPRDPSHRTPAYREMLTYGWEEYVYAFVLPWLQEQGVATTGAEVFAANDLRSLEAGLAGNERFWVFSSANDFLRRPEDSAWLEATLAPGHLSLEGHGGHMGAAWDPAARARVVAELREALASAPTTP